jgi:glycosyltransferase involved in cell wall biosynthesis
MSLSFIVGSNDTIPRSVATSESVKVSLVIPAFNEAARIQDTLRRIAEYLKNARFDNEILVVDDGSTDETSAIVERLGYSGLRLIRNDRNRGKGYSVRNGVLAATGDYVLFSDADLSTPIEELDKLLIAAENENADVVVGSRGIDSRYIEKHQSSVREGGGRLFNVMVRMVLGLNISDTQCGFKLFRREKVQSAFQKQTTDGFGFDPELLFVMSQQGLKILEVPVRWSHAEGSKIRFLRDGARMFTDLLRIRWNNLTGKYS